MVLKAAVKESWMFSVEGAGTWSAPQEISVGSYKPEGALGLDQIGPAGIAPSASDSSGGTFVVASEQFGAPNQTDVFLLSETGRNGPGWPTEFWVGGSGPWGGPVALVTEA